MAWKTACNALAGMPWCLRMRKAKSVRALADVDS